MAYLAEDENLKQDQQNQDGSATQEKVISSGNTGPIQGSSSQGSASSQATSGTPAPTKSGSFTNLMNYVDANQGNDSKMGQAVGNVVSNKADQATNQKVGFQDSAQAAINKGKVETDTATLDTLKTDATKVDRDAFSRMHQADYDKLGGLQSAQSLEGPGGFSDVNNAFARVNQTAQDATGNLNQRTNVLKEAYGRPQYTRGEQRLDSFIVGAGQGGQQELQKVAEQNEAVQGNWANTLNLIGENIQGGRATTDATRQAAQDAHGSALGSVQERFVAAQQKAGQTNKQIQDSIANLNKQLTSSDPAQQAQAAKALGLDPATVEFVRSQGGDVTKLFTAGGQVAAGDLISAQDEAQYKALRDLVGQSGEQDFSRTGNTGTAFSANQQAINAAQQLQQIRAEAEAEAKRQTDQRKNDFNNLGFGGISGQFDSSVLAQQIGVDAGQLERYMAANPHMTPEQIRKGLLSSDILSNPQLLEQSLRAEDVMSSQQRQQWSELSKLLGLGDLSAANTTNPYAIDTSWLSGQLANFAEPAPTPAPVQQQVAPTPEVQKKPNSWTNIFRDIGLIR
jgi:hypothetical protein